MNPDTFYTFLEESIKSFRSSARHGRPDLQPMIETDRVSYWLACALPCGHPETTIIVRDGESLTRQHGIRGPFIERYPTVTDAWVYLCRVIEGMPARREAMIRSIEPRTLRAVLKGDETFPGARVSPRTDWALSEQLLASRLIHGLEEGVQPYRTIDRSQDIEYAQCVCNAHRRTSVL